jgi:hypothetical protein
MRAYREDVHKHMVAQGRRPSDCKVLYLINPIVDSGAVVTGTRRVVFGS